MDFWPAWTGGRFCGWSLFPPLQKAKYCQRSRWEWDIFSVFATNFSTFGFLSFGWITNSCFLVYIHLDADAKWDPVCVQSAPAGQSINMVLHSSPCQPPLHPPVSRQITTKTNCFEAWVNKLWTISSYLEKATLCSVSPLQLFGRLALAKQEQRKKVFGSVRGLLEVW